MCQHYKQSNGLYLEATFFEGYMEAIWKSIIVVMIFKLYWKYEILDKE